MQRGKGEEGKESIGWKRNYEEDGKINMGDMACFYPRIWLWIQLDKVRFLHHNGLAISAAKSNIGINK